MGFGFTFTAGKKDLQENDLIKIVGELAQKRGYQFSWQQNAGFVELCRNGRLFLQKKEDAVLGDCQTNVVGAGFHAAAIDFVDEMVEKAHLLLHMEDETNYYAERDFAKLRGEHYYHWLHCLMDLLKEEKEYTQMRICWPVDGYAPEERENTIITPMGYYDIPALLEWVQKDTVYPFGAEFFIWDSREQDARFSRNSALSLMWEECYFMPSARSEADCEINGRIIGLLEAAAAQDPNLPFPKKDYLLLCSLHGSQPIDISKLPDYTLFSDIGYRKGKVVYQLGNLSLKIEGSFLNSYDEAKEAEIFYDDLDKNWHTIQISAFRYDEQPVFHEQLLQDENAAERFSFPIDGGMCQAVLLQKQTDQYGSFWQLVAQVLSDKQMTWFIIAYEQEKEKSWACEFLQSLKVVKENEETV